MGRSARKFEKIENWGNGRVKKERLTSGEEQGHERTGS